MNMPKLAPIAIPTKGKKPLAKLRAWITEVRQWQLVEDWQYQLPDQQVIIIPKGFVFDGASIPRLLWGVLSPTGLLLIPGLIHDFGYRYDYLWRLRSDGKVEKAYCRFGQKRWDKQFYQVGLAVNDMPVVNFLAWLALYSMGRYAWRSNRKRAAEELFPSRDIYPHQHWSCKP